jgi:hypothetical protein
MEIQEIPTPRKPKLPHIIGGNILILLLAGAAFVAARLLNGQGLPLVTSGGPIFSIGKGGENSVRINVDDIQAAKELPQTPADVRGLFDHRQDNSIFIGTGKVTIGVSRDPSGHVETTSNHDGPVVEIVITSQTKMYKDVTMRQLDGPPPQGQKIQQVLEPGSSDEIGQASLITVWGKRTGDRFIAEIVVYSPPVFSTK